MTAETIIKTIDRMCDGQCAYWINQSETTNSIYCTMKHGNAVTHFRVSDHQTSKRIRSFVFGKRTKVVSLERFINNALKDLKTKYIYTILESISTTVECA